jgi:hypothetical protein
LIIAPQPRKGKEVSPPHNKQSVITVQAPKPSLSRAASPTPVIAQLVAEQIAIAQNNIAKLVAEQITIAQNNTAQLIAEQVALALAAQSGNLQSPQKFDH